MADVLIESMVQIGDGLEWVYTMDVLTGEVGSRMLPTASIFDLNWDMASEDTLLD